jgi:uncharacterized protein (DUF2336 family)
MLLSQQDAMTDLIMSKAEGASSFDVVAAMALARSSSANDRERLLLAIAELCRSDAECARPEIQELLRGLFLDLVSSAEQAIRLRLSKTLADVAWAPHDLIRLLAHDEIEIARPVLAKSPVLTDADLIRLLLEASIEHRIEVARRPALSADVAAAIVDQADPDVVTALANNTTADLRHHDLSRLVDLSERVAGLRAPIARHPGLSAELAALLYGWVGEALRNAIIARFPLDTPDLQRAVAASVHEVRTDLGLSPGSDPADSVRAVDRTAMERRVIAKLEAAGQLRPGVLVRALNEGKLGLFVTALAALAGVSTEDVRSAIKSEQPDTLLVICSLSGIDKGAFPSMLSMVRRLNDGRPSGGLADPAGVDLVKVPADQPRQSPV